MWVTCHETWGTQFLPPLELLQMGFSALTGDLPCVNPFERAICGCMKLMDVHNNWRSCSLNLLGLLEKSCIRASSGWAQPCWAYPLPAPSTEPLLPHEPWAGAGEMSGGGSPLWEALSMLLLALITMECRQAALKIFFWFRKNFLKDLVQRKKLIDSIWKSVMLAKSWNRDHVLDHVVVVTWMSSVWWKFRDHNWWLCLFSLYRHFFSEWGSAELENWSQQRLEGFCIS